MTQALFSHSHFSPSTWGLVFAVSAAILLWLVSLRLRDVSIVDIFWGPGRHVSFNFKGDLHLRIEQAGKMLNHGSGYRINVARQPGLDLSAPRHIFEMPKETFPRKPEGKEALVARIGKRISVGAAPSNPAATLNGERSRHGKNHAM